MLQSSTHMFSICACILIIAKFSSIVDKKNQNWLRYGIVPACNRGASNWLSFLINNCRFSLFLWANGSISCRFQPNVRIIIIMCVLLSSACMFRYNGLSLVYFLFVLTVPMLPNPSLVTMKGERRKSKMCTVTEHLENTKWRFVTS